MPKKVKSAKSASAKKLPKTPPKHFNKIQKQLYREGTIGLDGKPLYVSALPSGINRYEGFGLKVDDKFADVVDIPINFMEEPQDFYTITQVKNIVNNNFDTQEIEYTIDAIEDIDFDDIVDFLPDLIDTTIESEDLSPEDKIQISFDGFESDFVDVSDADELIDALSDVNRDNYYSTHFDTQTKSFVTIAFSLDVKINIIKLDSFVGAGQKKIINKDDIKFKKSVIRICNDDDLCLGRCIVIANAIRTNHPQLKQIKMGRKIQTTLTHELYESYGIEKKISDINMIKDFEKILDCSITIVDADGFNNVIYPEVSSNDYQVKDFNIYLLKSGEHFDLINSKQVAGFFCKNNWCDKCKKPYNQLKDHSCIYKCGLCCRGDCDFIGGDFGKVKDWKTCDDCWRHFPTQICYDNHLLKDVITRGENKGKLQKSVCEKIFKCPKCKERYDKEKFSMETHRCGDYWCGNCKCVANEKEHKCYMMPKKVNIASENIIFFDFEATQNTGKHIVNYCIAKYYNDPTPIEFFTIDSFMTWLLDKKHKGFSVIAHNGRGYDFQLIQEYIYKHTIMKPKNVYAGSKIMILELKDLQMRFVDSLNFLTMKLEAFPKTFGIKELKKGFFPHFYNTAENFNYIGKIPDMKYFGYNSMTTKNREEFIKWWVAKRLCKYEWNMYEEMKSYCISDVDILRRSCIIFRELFLKIADIDPFTYTTIASVCMAIYKNKYITEPIDYDPVLNPSLWLLQAQEEEKIAILPYEQQQFIRKSFFGGRTNSIKLKYNFTGTEEGKYADITSLYPSVNYYDEYPIGHPVEITENFGDPTKYFGFIECDIECPKDLYFPVLATKGEKLLFDLTDKRGVWTTIEINKALEKGYKIKKIYKVLHFKQRSNQLFKKYVSTFLKIKQEASGFPDWVKTEKDKLLYLKQYEEQQGILLDIDKIEYNPGLRAIAKLCLNSLWGKFGQRLNLPKTEIITEKKKFHSILLDERYEKHRFHYIDEHRMEMTWREREESIEANYNTNIAVASFTTAHARLRLYWALERLDRQVLYHDTDSVIYVYDPNNPQHKDIELGDCLGEWTDELEGWKMKGTFVGAGPKNYSYEKHKDGKIKHETKIKGFTLNHAATQDEVDKETGEIKNRLNHNTMMKVVDDHMNGEKGQEKKIVVTYNMINRNKTTKVLTSVIQDKAYGFCYDKRTILKPDDRGNIDTRPYGWEGET
jgi:hypothetical protein